VHARDVADTLVAGLAPLVHEGTAEPAVVMPAQRSGTAVESGTRRKT